MPATTNEHTHDFRGPAGRQWKCVTCGEPLTGPEALAELEQDNHKDSTEEWPDEISFA